MNKTQKHFLIAAAIGLLIFFFCPAANGLTEQGVKLLSVFVPTVYIWLVIGGGAWSSFFSVTMIVLLGIYDGASVYELQWGGSMVAMIIPFFMLANVLEESGALIYIVRWILSRKIVHGRPTLFTILFALSIILVSVFVTPIVTCVLFFKILREMTESIGLDKNSDFYKAHGVMIGWFGQTCDGCLIWGRPFIFSMVALVAGFGFASFTVMDYMKLSLTYLAFFTVAALLIIKFWFRPDMSNFKYFDDEAIRKELKANPMSKRAKIALVGMAVVLLCYVAAFTTPLGVVQQYFNGLPVAAPISIVVAILALITVDKEPVLDIGRQAAKLPWGTIMFLGTVMFYSGIVGGEEYGIAAVLQNILEPIVSNIPVMVAIFVGLAVAAFLTNLTSNAVTVIVVTASFLPVLLAIPGISQANILAFASCVIALCATAFCTLSACATMAVVYCDDGIERKGVMRYSIVLTAVMVLISTFILVPMGNVFFGGMF